MILAAETGDWTGRVEGVGLSETKVLDQFQLPIGHWFDQMVDWMDVNAEWFLNAVKWPFDFLLENMVNDFLLTLPWYQVVIFTVIVGSLVRTPKIGIMAGAGLTMCGLLGAMYWVETMRTIGMVLVAVGLCALIGVPLGVSLAVPLIASPPVPTFSVTGIAASTLEREELTVDTVPRPRPLRSRPRKSAKCKSHFLLSRHA